MHKKYWLNVITDDKVALGAKIKGFIFRTGTSRVARVVSSYYHIRHIKNLKEPHCWVSFLTHLN